MSRQVVFSFSGNIKSPPIFVDALTETFFEAMIQFQPPNESNEYHLNLDHEDDMVQCTPEQCVRILCLLNDKYLREHAQLTPELLDYFQVPHVTEPPFSPYNAKRARAEQLLVRAIRRWNWTRYRRLSIHRALHHFAKLQHYRGRHGFMAVTTLSVEICDTEIYKIKRLGEVLLSVAWHCENDPNITEETEAAEVYINDVLMMRDFHGRFFGPYPIFAAQYVDMTIEFPSKARRYVCVKYMVLDGDTRTRQIRCAWYPNGLKHNEVMISNGMACPLFSPYNCRGEDCLCQRYPQGSSFALPLPNNIIVK